MNELKDFLAEQYGMELGAFRTALEGIPAQKFGAAVAGHTPAWHAVHIAEWLRLGVLGDGSATYAHLGWEDQAWVETLQGEPPVSEGAGKAAVLAHLEDVAQQVLTWIRGLAPADLEGNSFSPSAPGGERPRLGGLGLHLRHIAYHRGQVRLVMKEMA